MSVRVLLVVALVAVFSSPVAATGTTNNALSFDGVDDYVLVSNPASFNVGSSTDFTIEAVIKTTKTNAPIFSKMGASNVVGYQFWVFQGRLLLEWSGSQNISSAVLVNDGQCHHVAVVVDRSAQNAKLYVDGVLQANVTHSRYGQNVDNTNPVYIGQERLQLSAFKFLGEMDEVAFFTSARTATEIQASATSQLTGTEPGLLGYWKFDEGTAGGNNAGVTTLPDASGNGNDGALQNFALNGSSSNWVASSCAQPALDSDGDGVPDVDDAFPISDTSPTVVVGGTDTGVPNASVGGGATMNDLIGACADNPKNHGQFVSCVTQLTNDWRKAGLITKAQEKLIDRAAAKSDVGKS